MSDEKRIRYAVAGLGYISQAAILPAFKNAKDNSELTALVSGDPVKLEELGERYEVSGRFTYEQFDECLKQVDAVYLGLPNHLHREYTERAARAGVHVLCEKPLAVTEGDCLAMVQAAEENKIRLMTAYRLHFEEPNLRAIEIAGSGELGELRYFQSAFSQQVAAGNIRLRAEPGGGTLYDIGIYCINAARYLFQDEPVEVMGWTASNSDSRFREVEEMTSALLRFPGERMANFVCSFGADTVSTYELAGTKGHLRLDSAYDFDVEKKCEVTVGGKKETQTFPRSDQFGPELLYFSECIIHGVDAEPSGLEGLADVRVIEALYESAASGKPVKLAPFDHKRKPTPEQEITRPPVKQPELIHAKEPSFAA